MLSATRPYYIKNYYDRQLARIYKKSILFYLEQCIGLTLSSNITIKSRDCDISLHINLSNDMLMFSGLT
jgi:hypothetical protein